MDLDELNDRFLGLAQRYEPACCAATAPIAAFAFFKAPTGATVRPKLLDRGAAFQAHDS
jgi:hypothetical protein